MAAILDGYASKACKVRMNHSESLPKFMNRDTIPKTNGLTDPNRFVRAFSPVLSSVAVTLAVFRITHIQMHTLPLHMTPRGAMWS